MWTPSLNLVYNGASAMLSLASARLWGRDVAPLRYRRKDERHLHCR
jgi:hypothetical protein